MATLGPGAKGDPKNPDLTHAEWEKQQKAATKPAPSVPRAPEGEAKSRPQGEAKSQNKGA